METIWQILILAGMVSIAIFLQVLSCFAFGNNWCAGLRSTRLGLPGAGLRAPHQSRVVAISAGCR